MSSQCLRITLNLLGLVRELRRLPHETKWVEFKANQRDPRAIGEYVSALMNAASLHGKARAYVLWWIEDGALVVVGTIATRFPRCALLAADGSGRRTCP